MITLRSKLNSEYAVANMLAPCAAQVMAPDVFRTPCCSLTSMLHFSAGMSRSAASLQSRSPTPQRCMACCWRRPRRRYCIRCCRPGPATCSAAVGAAGRVLCSRAAIGAAVCGCCRAAIQFCSLQLSRHGLQPNDRTRLDPRWTANSR